MKLITDYLDKSASDFPDKAALIDEDGSMTYQTLTMCARKVGSSLAQSSAKSKAPVAVYMHRGSRCVAAMLGVAYSGNFYVVIDSQMPADRIRFIFDVVHPCAIVTEQGMLDKAQALAFNGCVLVYEELMNAAPDMALLETIRSRMVSTDLLYCLFTSGSTGVPKGAAVSHANVIAYTQWAAGTFAITSDTIFGSQTPFYFSMSVTDLYSTLCTGATMVIIPKKFFAFPVKLAEYMNRYEVNTIYWVPSALSIVANLDLFKYIQIPSIRKVLFAGEVMPVRQLNYWMRQYPEALFANLFGPTETTDICTYYIVDREFADGESLPIGKACDNCDVMVLNEQGKECADGDEGELYARGPFVVCGYYNNPEKTREVFVQNPLNPAYPELVYKTGDIVRYNERGELLYAGRKDFQIKHMGYRIELGEIEAAVMANVEVDAAVCIYDAPKDAIVLIYQGKAPKEAVAATAKSRLPAYMLPSRMIRTASLPHNSNGKIDRAWLKDHYTELIGD